MAPCIKIPSGFLPEIGPAIVPSYDPIMSQIAVELLKLQADVAFQEFLGAIEGVEELQAWGVMPQTGQGDLNTDGSIHGIVLHVATGKVMYASSAFKGTEIRWRDVADEIESFEPSWTSAQEYLKAAQKYWMESWAHLADEDLLRDVQRPQGNWKPAWEIVYTVLGHDAYHAGQVALLRCAGQASSTPPPSVAEDLRKHCPGLPTW